MASVDSGGWEIALYERITDDEGKVTIEAPGFRKGSKLEALATIGGRHNQTFLATIRATLEPTDYGDDLSAVLNWFESKLTLIRPTANYRRLGWCLLLKKPAFIEFASSFLRAASTGIEALNVIKKEVTEEELRSLAPDSLVRRLTDEPEGEGEGEGLQLARLGNEKWVLVERTDGKHYFLVRVCHEISVSLFLQN